jgi:tripeptidyl-peptidase-1
MYLRATLFVAVVSQALPILGAVHERLHAIPNGWTECSSAPDNSSTITLTVALAQQNLDQLDSRLMAISTPGNPSYGQHLSKVFTPF